MSQSAKPERSRPGSDLPGGGSPTNTGGGTEQGQKRAPPTTISGFFEEPKASPSSFFKALRSRKVRRFTPGDIAKAAQLMADMDPDGERLWALMSQSSLPDAVDRWIWKAAQDRLEQVLGDSFDPHDVDAERMLRSLRDSLAPKLRSEDKQERKRAETWLRIGICWLVEKRSLKPWTVTEAMRAVYFGDGKLASRASRRALQKGRTHEFKLAIATATLAQEFVDAARAELDREREAAASLRSRLDDASALIEKLRSELATLRDELERKTEALAAAESRFAAERQHWGHDLTEAKAEQRVLLGERLAPRLSEAIDALEIEPPQPGIALKRLRIVLSLIEEANS